MRISRLRARIYGENPAGLQRKREGEGEGVAKGGRGEQGLQSEHKVEGEGRGL